MSALATSLADYLTVRRALGARMERGEALLKQFVDYCDSRGIDTVTVEIAQTWAMLPSNQSVVWWNTRLCAVRPFARWLRAVTPATEVPPTDLFGRINARRSNPHIYTDVEIVALMTACSHFHTFILRATYETLIGLLAVTGMRIGEAINLDDDDIDWEQQTLTLRSTKFGGSRLLCLQTSTIHALRSYMGRRDSLLPNRATKNLFVSCRGTRLFHSAVTEAFHRTLEWAHLQPDASGHRPRVHDLRHTFAVTTLRDWHFAGVDVEVRLPLLSTYMGHVKPKDTYWYLSASPELLAAAAARLAIHQNGGVR